MICTEACMQKIHVHTCNVQACTINVQICTQGHVLLLKFAVMVDQLYHWSVCPSNGTQQRIAVSATECFNVAYVEMNSKGAYVYTNDG